MKLGSDIKEAVKVGKMNKSVSNQFASNLLENK